MQLNFKNELCCDSGWDGITYGPSREAWPLV